MLKPSECFAGPFSGASGLTLILPRLDNEKLTLIVKFDDQLQAIFLDSGGDIAAFHSFPCDGNAYWNGLHVPNVDIELDEATRTRSQMFSALQSHYLFEDKFGRPGKGNDKGNVEGLVGLVRRRFMVPMPVATDFAGLNAKFRDQCVARQAAVLRGHTLSIGERLKADQAAFMPLPAVPFDPCHIVPGRASSTSLVRYRTNDYSVPTAHAHQDVVIKGYPKRHRPCCRLRDWTKWFQRP